MDKYSYGWEQLFGAIHCLTGSESQRIRLVNAIVYNLIHITPENDLPPSVRSEFTTFIADMTAVEAQKDEGNVRATIDSLDEIGVGRAIDRIISFYDAVCRHRKPD
jgi:hypothetical protein